MKVLGAEFEKVSSAENLGATILAAGVLALSLFRWEFTHWETTPAQLFAYTLLTYGAVMVERSAFRFADDANALDVGRWVGFLACFLVLAVLCFLAGIGAATVFGVW